MRSGNSIFGIIDQILCIRREQAQRQSRLSWLGTGAWAVACAATLQLGGCARDSAKGLSANLREEGSKAALQASDEIEVRKKETAIAATQSRTKTPEKSLAATSPRTSRSDSVAATPPSRRNPLAELLERDRPAPPKNDPFLAQASTTPQAPAETQKRKSDPALAQASTTAPPRRTASTAVSKADSEWEALLEQKLAISRQSRAPEGSSSAGQVAATSTPRRETTAPGANGTVQRTSGTAGSPAFRRTATASDQTLAAARPFPAPSDTHSTASQTSRSTSNGLAASSNRPAISEAPGMTPRKNLASELDAARPDWMKSSVRESSELVTTSKGSNPIPSWAQPDAQPQPETAVAPEAAPSVAAANSPALEQEVEFVQPGVSDSADQPLLNTTKVAEVRRSLAPVGGSTVQQSVNRLLPVGRRADVKQRLDAGETRLASGELAAHESPARVAPKPSFDGDRLRVQALMTQAQMQVARGELQAAYRTALEAKDEADRCEMAFAADAEHPAALAEQIADQLWGPGLNHKPVVASVPRTGRTNSDPAAETSPDRHQAVRNAAEDEPSVAAFSQAFGKEGAGPQWRTANLQEGNHEIPSDLRRDLANGSGAPTGPVVLTRASEASLPTAADQGPAVIPVNAPGRQSRFARSTSPIVLTHIETEAGQDSPDGLASSLPLDAPFSGDLANSHTGNEALFVRPMPAELPALPAPSGEGLMAAASETKSAGSAAPAANEAEKTDHSLIWAMVGFIAAAASTVIGLRVQRRREQENAVAFAESTQRSDTSKTVGESAAPAAGRRAA